MIPHVDTETLRLELDERRLQAALRREVRAREASQVRHGQPLRWALANGLVALTGRVLGGDGWFYSRAASAESSRAPIVVSAMARKLGAIEDNQS